MESVLPLQAMEKFNFFMRDRPKRWYLDFETESKALEDLSMSVYFFYEIEKA